MHRMRSNVRIKIQNKFMFLFFYRSSNHWIWPQLFSPVHYERNVIACNRRVLLPFLRICVYSFHLFFSVFLCPPLWTRFRLSFKIEQSNGFLYNIVASICAWRTCPMQTNAIFAFFSFYSFALFISNVFKINQRITIVFVLFRFRKIIRQRN